MTALVDLSALPNTNMYCVASGTMSSHRPDLARLWQYMSAQMKKVQPTALHDIKVRVIGVLLDLR